MDFLIDGTSSSGTTGTCSLILRANHSSYASALRCRIQFQGASAANEYYMGVPSAGGYNGQWCFAPPQQHVILIVF